MHAARLRPTLALIALATAAVGPNLRAQDPPGATRTSTAPPDRPSVCLVSTDDRLLAGPGAQFRAAATNYWKRSTLLKVMFVDGGDARFDPLRRKIERFAKEWEAFANIGFSFQGVARKDVNGDITEKGLDIAIQLEADQFFPARTYQSFYGPDSHSYTRAMPPARSMWLIFPTGSKDGEIRRVTLHEFGHALGLIHEQKRPDLAIKWNREKVLEFYKFTSWSDEDIEDQVMKRYGGPIAASSPFDPTSIMIYPIPPGLATNLAAGWSNELSPMDRLFIGTLYPFSEISPPRQIALDAETDVEIARAGEIVRYRFTIGRDGQFEVTSSGCPAIVGLMDNPSIGPITRPAAAEGNPATFVAELKADSPNKKGDKPGTYYLYIRHREGRTGTGKLKVRVRPLKSPVTPGARP